MNTIILDEPGKLRMMQSDDPAEPGPGFALVRVHRVGICGTDWHAFHGRQPFFSYPRILGHELGVEVIKVNDPQSKLKPGSRCAVEPYLHCGKCIACRQGKINCCTNLQVMGVHVDGGMRDRILVPTNKLHASEKLSFEQLALVETLAIGCHAVERGTPKAGEWALVIGAGPIGLSVIPFLLARSAKVIVADVSASRLEFCRDTLKVQETVDATGDVPAALAKVTGGDLPTLVIDATGNPGSMNNAFGLVAAGGRLVFVGLHQGEVTFNDPQFHRREMTLLASRNALPADFDRIIGMVEAGTIDTRPWITHRAACGELIEQMPGWLNPNQRLIKAMVEF